MKEYGFVNSTIRHSEGVDNPITLPHLAGTNCVVPSVPRLGTTCTTAWYCHYHGLVHAAWCVFNYVGWLIYAATPQPCKGLRRCRRFSLSGAGGSRTLVQTAGPYAFYTLIPALVFVCRQDPGHQPTPYPLNLTLQAGLCRAIPDIAAPLCRNASGREPPSGVPFRHLVAELSR